MSTILGIGQVPLTERPTRNSLRSFAHPEGSHPSLAPRERLTNLAGVTGAAITLTVLFSGVYVFVRYLL